MLVVAPGFCYIESDPCLVADLIVKQEERESVSVWMWEERRRGCWWDANVSRSSCSNQSATQSQGAHWGLKKVRPRHKLKQTLDQDTSHLWQSCEDESPV